MRAYRRVPYNPVVQSLVALREEADHPGPRVKLSCGAGRNDQGVDVDGRVYPCHRYVGMAPYAIGDVWRGLDPQKVDAYYRRLLAAYPDCENCWATRWCAGACPRYLSHPSGEIVSPDAEYCAVVRRNVERSLALEALLDSEGIDWERLRREAAAN